MYATTGQFFLRWEWLSSFLLPWYEIFTSYAIAYSTPIKSTLLFSLVENCLPAILWFCLSDCGTELWVAIFGVLLVDSTIYPRYRLKELFSTYSSFIFSTSSAVSLCHTSFPIKRISSAMSPGAPMFKNSQYQRLAPTHGGWYSWKQSLQTPWCAWLLC